MLATTNNAKTDTYRFHFTDCSIKTAPAYKSALIIMNDFRNFFVL